MYQANGFIWLGVNADAWDKPKLKALSIHASLNLSVDKIVPNVTEHLHVYVPDGFSVDYADIRLIFAWLDAMYGSGHKILIHCMSGISVGPSIFIAWLIHHRGIRPQEMMRIWHDEEKQLRLLHKPISCDLELKMSLLKYLVRDSTPINGR